MPPPRKSGQPTPADSAARHPPVRKITPQRLENIALFHLQRYATSAANLRSVLLRRVDKAARFHEIDRAQAVEWIDDLVGRLVRSGAVDDNRYAEGRARALLRQGRSPLKVRGFLRSKGVDPDVIDSVLRALSEHADPEHEAAMAYASRRRFGPFRTEPASPERRQKELAAMGRAGFSYGTAKAIVDSDDGTS